MLSLICCQTGSAQDTLWTATYGDVEDDFGWDVQQTSDGGFIVAGETSSGPVSGLSDAWLVKTDAAGAAIWQQRYGDALSDAGVSVRETFDTGYVLVGQRATPGSNSDMFVTRTNDVGAPLWTRTFGNQFTIDAARSVIQTADSGFVVAGFIRTPINGDDLALVRLDSLGNTVWSRLIGGVRNDKGHAVIQTADSGFVVAGETASSGVSQAGDVWIVKTDSLGSLEWERNYGDDGYDVAKSVQQTSDGGYILAGAKQNNQDAWLLRTDSQGDTLWTKRFGGAFSDEARSVVQTADGGFALAGLSGMDGDVYIVKTDADGNLEWDRTFGGPGLDYGNAIQEIAGGGFVVIAFTSSFGSGKYDAWLLRIHAPPVAIEGEPVSVDAKPVLYAPYPNPNHGFTNFEYELRRPGYVTVSVVDVRGRLIRTLVDGYQDTGRKVVSWRGDAAGGAAVASGVYFFRLQTPAGVWARKAIVVR